VKVAKFSCPRADSRGVWRNALALAVIALAAACGGGGTSFTPNKFLYVSAYAGPNNFPAGIFGFGVDANGGLRAVSGSPAPTSDGGGPIAITRDSKLLYTTQYNQLLAFDINTDGSMTASSAPGVYMPDTPINLVAHPTADFLYVSGSSGTVTVFAIDPSTGALTQASSVILGSNLIGTDAQFVPGGQFQYQNNVYPSIDNPTAWQIAGYSVDGMTGALSPAAGSPLSAAAPAGASPGTMAIDPSGKFLFVSYNFFVVNVGADGGVLAYTINASGQLAVVPGSPFPVGGVPTSIAVDSTGKYLIAATYARLGGAAGNCLAVLAINSNTGALASVPGSPFGPMNSCATVAADPSEPYVYVGSSLTNNNPATVSVLSVDPSSGTPTRVGSATISSKLGVADMALTH
jgi:6-phosphogluconolactonase (cycloisomerase 2 family)